LIADKAGKMYDKFVGFVENLNDIKMRLDQADNLKQLGASNNKKL